MEQDIEDLRHVVDRILIDNAVLRAEIKAVRGAVYNFVKQHQSKEEYTAMNERFSKVYKALALQYVKELKGAVYHESTLLNSLFDLEQNL